MTAEQVVKKDIGTSKGNLSEIDDFFEKVDQMSIGQLVNAL